MKFWTPIHREGWPFIAAFAVATLLLATVGQSLLWLGLLATGWCVYFFRDPERVPPTRSDVVVSPADGVISAIALASPPAELALPAVPRLRISVFMNIFDVHVNRAPADATVARMRYRAGRFVNASLDKASEGNERMSFRLDLGDGRDLVMVQIAGLVARRIVDWVSEGQPLALGQRVGMIRFGSRVDLYLPAGTSSLVSVGQRMTAGETVIADLRAPRSPPAAGVASIAGAAAAGASA